MSPVVHIDGTAIVRASFRGNACVFQRASTMLARHARAMSPTIFRSGDLRFFFFSCEEARMHVHVQSPNGVAKIWL